MPTLLGLMVGSSCLRESGPSAVAASKHQAGDAGPFGKGEIKPKGQAEQQEDQDDPGPVDLAAPVPNEPPEPLDAPSDALAPDARPQTVQDAEARLTQTYSEQLAQLQERRVELKRKDNELTQANQALMAKLETLTALEERLQQELGIGKARKEYRGQRIEALAALIMTMPPQSGAQILSNMSEADAQDIVLGMARKSERKAAKILAQMPPERAAGLGRRYLSPRNIIQGSEGLMQKNTVSEANKGAP